MAKSSLTHCPVSSDEVDEVPNKVAGACTPGPALPTGPVIPAVCGPDDPRVLLHGHECRVKLRAYIARDDLSISEAKVSIDFYLLEPRPGLASSNHPVPCHTHPVPPARTKVQQESKGNLKERQPQWPNMHCLWPHSRSLRCLLMLVGDCRSLKNKGTPERMFTLSLR